uniref:RecQ mediated genome instability protein 1 OB-fold domain-containing protein n=1 Tax=Amphimedon queenslandica TaxID=400682 RepID=A0A1X7UYY3_AMPQE
MAAESTPLNPAMLALIAKEGWSLSDEGLSLCVEGCSKDGGKVSQNTVIAQALNLDLRKIGKKSLPELSKNREINGKLVLQIQKVSNVAVPTSKHHDDSCKKRLLKLQLTDGHNYCHAIEYGSPIPHLRPSSPPGTKLLISSKVNVVGGFLLLTEKSTVILGGHVEHMIKKWNLEKTSENFQRVQSSGTGPPPFIPLTATANKTSVQQRKTLPTVRQAEKSFKSEAPSRQLHSCEEHHHTDRHKQDSKLEAKSKDSKYYDDRSTASTGQLRTYHDGKSGSSDSKTSSSSYRDSKSASYHDRKSGSNDNKTESSSYRDSKTALYRDSKSASSDSKADSNSYRDSKTASYRDSKSASYHDGRSASSDSKAALSSRHDSKTPSNSHSKSDAASSYHGSKPYYDSKKVSSSYHDSRIHHESKSSSSYRDSETQHHDTISYRDNKSSNSHCDSEIHYHHEASSHRDNKSSSSYRDSRKTSDSSHHDSKRATSYHESKTPSYSDTKASSKSYHESKGATGSSVGDSSSHRQDKRYSKHNEDRTGRGFDYHDKRMTSSTSEQKVTTNATTQQKKDTSVTYNWDSVVANCKAPSASKEKQKDKMTH